MIPAGTPPAVVARVDQDLEEMREVCRRLGLDMDDPDVRNALALGSFWGRFGSSLRRASLGSLWERDRGGTE